MLYFESFMFLGDNTGILAPIVGVRLLKLVMYEFHCDYMVTKYAGGADAAHGENLKLCYMDTDSLVYHIKMEDFYADITGDVKEKLHTSGYDASDDRPLPL